MPHFSNPRQERVLQAIAEIPRGRVTTYGEIARHCRIPSPRQVGQLLHTNPDDNTFPCHRVVMASGALAPGYAFGGPEVQRQRLEAEGVLFVRDRVVMKQCNWVWQEKNV